MGHVFDPEVIHECTNKGVGLPLEEAFNVITDALAHVYPENIYTGPRNWIFNNAGGAMGQITLLHASLSEYILIFGSPLRTQGHSGRYHTEVWDFMIAGEMWCFHEGDSERQVFKPGDGAYLGEARAKGYCLPDHGWMVEYARGPIPSMIPFGVADTVMSTLDMRSLGRTIGNYGSHVLSSLLRGKL